LLELTTKSLALEFFTELERFEFNELGCDVFFKVDPPKNVFNSWFAQHGRKKTEYNNGSISVFSDVFGSVTQVI
jgi:hypothetical protein